MMVRGNYAQLMATGTHHNFVEWLDTLQREEEFSKIFNVENSEKAFEDDVQYAGVPPMPEKTEGGAVLYQDAIQGGSIRYIHLTYALGCRASFELIDDDQYKIIEQVPKALSRSASFTKEMVPWNVFNNGFVSLKTIDGLPLFSTSHPLLGGVAATNIAPGVSNIIASGGTYPNRPTTDTDLSFTAIQFMSNMFERLPDSMGMPIVMKPRILVLPPPLKFIARELLGSPGKPGTGDNDINSLLGEDLTYTLAHYITSDSTWYAVCEKSQHQLIFFWRKKPDNDYDDDFDTDSVKVKTKMRFSAGASHWLGTWGTVGP
jgi:phage major head subunit gpT-like protein